MADGQANVTLGRQLGVTDEYLRVWKLTVFNAQGASQVIGGTPASVGGGISNASFWSSDQPTGQAPGIETYAAGLRISFTVTLATSETCNTAEITLYNISDDTADMMIEEYNYVILQAGYLWGQCGNIFTGSIKMYKKGHETAVDSYLKLYCADGDKAINFATSNETHPAGTSKQEAIQRVASTMGQHGVSIGEIDNNSLNYSQSNYRGTPNYGTSADMLRDYAKATGNMWHVLNQQFYFTKPTYYDPGEIVQITGETGLIGFPEMTPDGLNVTTLINPSIALNTRIQLDNKYINQYFQPGGISGGTVFTQWSSEGEWYFPVSEDGVYCVKMITYEGDSRGNAWYQYMVCLSVDQGKSAAEQLIAQLLGGFMNMFT